MMKKKRTEDERNEKRNVRPDPAGGATEGSPDNGGDDRASETAALRLEVDELNGKWLRALADLDNYRKRVERDRSRWSETAREAIILDLLDVVDNLERALACDDQDAPPENGSFREGVELILRHLVDVLAKHGVTPIVADGCEFDPNVHEAVGHVETDECDADHVVEETQRGYKLGERLLRCSKVIVAK